MATLVAQLEFAVGQFKAIFGPTVREDLHRFAAGLNPNLLGTVPRISTGEGTLRRVR